MSVAILAAAPAQHGPFGAPEKGPNVVLQKNATVQSLNMRAEMEAGGLARQRDQRAASQLCVLLLFLLARCAARKCCHNLQPYCSGRHRVSLPPSPPPPPAALIAATACRLPFLPFLPFLQPCVDGDCRAWRSAHQRRVARRLPPSARHNHHHGAGSELLLSTQGVFQAVQQLAVSHRLSIQHR